MFSQLRESSLITRAFDYAQGTVEWALGFNNASAIKDVIKDDYHYNSGYGDKTTKIKQIGTEALHAGLKYSVIGTITDKSLTYLNLLSAPEAGTLHNSAHILADTSKDIAFLLKEHGATYAVDGSMSLFCLYGAKTIAGKTWEGVKNFAKADSDTSVKNLGIAALQTLTICVTTPIFKSYQAYGLMGATGAMALFVIAQKTENSFLKSALTLASTTYTALYLKSFLDTAQPK